MSRNNQCPCRRCTIRSLMGPAILITLGVLFLLAQLPGDVLDFHNTWPIILVVIGAISLASATASTEGHLQAQPNPPMPPRPQAAPPPPPAAPSNPPSEPEQ